jgi:hypothetical protein
MKGLFIQGLRKVYHQFTYESTLASSLRAQWALDDVLRADQELDFSRNFMAPSLAGTARPCGLDEAQLRTLNQIVAHQYLVFFERVEEFVLPFVLDHARPMLDEDDFRVRALLNFASEEAKHIHLFKRFRAAFVRGFTVPCAILGPPEELRRRVLSHHPLAVALLILMVEWMTQEHYLGSIRDDDDLDPLFKSLLKHHWMEEAQHAKLDTLIVEAVASGRGEREIAAATNEFFQMIGYLDRSLQKQVALNLGSLEQAIGSPIEQRGQLAAQLLRAARWTYLGTGMNHDSFKATLAAISPNSAARVAALVASAPALQSP